MVVNNLNGQIKQKKTFKSAPSAVSTTMAAVTTQQQQQEQKSIFKPGNDKIINSNIKPSFSTTNANFYSQHGRYFYLTGIFKNDIRNKIRYQNCAEYIYQLFNSYTISVPSTTSVDNVFEIPHSTGNKSTSELNTIIHDVIKTNGSYKFNLKHQLINIKHKQYELFLTVKCIENPWQHQEIVGKIELYNKLSMAKYEIPFQLTANRKKKNENLLFQHKINLKNFAKTFIINIQFRAVTKYQYFHLITGHLYKNRLFQLIFNHNMISHPQFSINQLATKPVTTITQKHRDEFEVNVCYEDEKKEKKPRLYFVYNGDYNWHDLSEINTIIYRYMGYSKSLYRIQPSVIELTRCKPHYLMEELVDAIKFAIRLFINVNTRTIRGGLLNATGVQLFNSMVNLHLLNNIELYLFQPNATVPISMTIQTYWREEIKKLGERDFLQQDNTFIMKQFENGGILSWPNSENNDDADRDLENGVFLLGVKVHVDIYPLAVTIQREKYDFNKYEEHEVPFLSLKDFNKHQDPYMYHYYNLISDYSNNAKFGEIQYLLGKLFENIGHQSPWKLSSSYGNSLVKDKNKTCNIILSIVHMIHYIKMFKDKDKNKTKIVYPSGYSKAANPNKSHQGYKITNQILKNEIIIDSFEAIGLITLDRNNNKLNYAPKWKERASSIRHILISLPRSNFLWPKKTNQIEEMFDQLCIQNKIKSNISSETAPIIPAINNVKDLLDSNILSLI